MIEAVRLNDVKKAVKKCYMRHATPDDYDISAVELDFMLSSIPVMKLHNAEPEWEIGNRPDADGVFWVTVQCKHATGYPDYELCYGEYDRDTGWCLFSDPVDVIEIVAYAPIEEPEPYIPKGGKR